jgi:hypothetical protein
MKIIFRKSHGILLMIFLFSIFLGTGNIEMPLVGIIFGETIENCNKAKPIYEARIIKGDNFYEVFIGNESFAKYVTNFEGTPIIYPIYGNGGKLMTRSFPMANRDVVSRDHLHHRSFWFSHGKVNDSDFWLTDKKLKNIGRIEHQKFLKAEVSGGTTAIIVTENNWKSHNDEILCSDIRSLRFGVTEFGNRYIDFNITVTAKVDKVTFHDTKEGTFAIRVADSLAVDIAREKKENEKEKNKEKNKKDQEIILTSYIVNAEGNLDEAAWGKRSSWVDYVGQFDNEIVGIAVMNHPSSFRYPTYWHVRTYGLFSANPFGERGFGIRKRLDAKVEQEQNGGGDFILERGKFFKLSYRVIFHDGNTKKASIAEEFKKYSSENF